MISSIPEVSGERAGALVTPASRVGFIPGHLAYLDSLRGLLATYVMLHHMYLHLPQLRLFQIGHVRIARICFGWLQGGHYAVDVFIVLSGFCLAMPIVRGASIGVISPGKFFVRRVRRILPPYYAALVLSLLLCWLWLSGPSDTWWKVAIPVRPADIIVHSLVLQDFYGSNRINSAMWSVATECHIYLFFPLLVLLWRKSGWLVVLASSVAAVAVAGFLFNYFQLPAPEAYWYVILFVLGMGAARLAFTTDPAILRWRAKTPWALIAAALSLTFLALFAFTNAGLEIMDCAVGGAAAAILVGLSTSKWSPVRRLMDSKLLVLLGAFSYSLYLMHVPLIEMVWLFLVKPLGLNVFASFLMLVAVGSPVIIFICYLFYTAFERPFVRGWPASLAPARLRGTPAALPVS